MAGNNETVSRPSLLTIKAATADLGISKTLLYELIKAGEIRTIFLGPQTPRVPRSEIDAYIARKLAGQREQSA